MPLPPALLARLKQRGIVKEGGAGADGDDGGEEVYAESYDRDDEEQRSMEDEQAGRYRGGAPGCPNKYNHYHVCTDYCFDHWREGWAMERLPSDYLDDRRRMLKRYPLPSGWKEIYDAGVRRHYYWCPATDEVCWLSPRHPNAVISEPAPKLAKELWQSWHDFESGGGGGRGKKRFFGKGRSCGDDEGGVLEPRVEMEEANREEPNDESEIAEMSDRERLRRARRRGIDPMDPAAYGEAPLGSWGSGLVSEVKTGVDVTATGPLFQQRPYPAPGAILRRQQPPPNSSGGGTGANATAIGSKQRR